MLSYPVPMTTWVLPGQENCVFHHFQPLTR